MKSYLLTIIICSVLLMFFPFIGLSEFWEYLFVVIPAFLIAYSAFSLSRVMKISLGREGADSLQEYVDQLNTRFKNEKKRFESSLKKQQQATKKTNILESEENLSE